MVNIAKPRGVRERHDRDLLIAAYRGGVGWVQPAEDERFTRSVTTTPNSETPEGADVGGELLAIIWQEIAALPDLQRSVITLCAVLGVGSRDVCARLGWARPTNGYCSIAGAQQCAQGSDYVAGDW